MVLGMSKVRDLMFRICGWWEEGGGGVSGWLVGCGKDEVVGEGGGWIRKGGRSGKG